MIIPLLFFSSGWSVKEAIETPIHPPGARRSALITFKGETKTKKQWSLLLGDNEALVANRIKQGWNIKRAITEIPRGYKCHI